MGKLTAKQVQHAKTGRHGDGDGLFLVVRPEGSRAWVLRVQVNGKRRDMGLGSGLTLTEAREKAATWRKLAKAGIDPVLESKKAHNEIPTFERVAREYHATIRAGWKNGKHGDQWLTTLVAHAFPSIGNRRVDLIEAPDVQELLLPIWLTIPETARRVRQRTGAVLDYAKSKGWRATEAPMRAINKGLPRQREKRGHFDAMPWQDVPAFLARLRAGPRAVGWMAVEFAILTAARSGEVRGATWGEVDLDRAEWTIGAERMKGGLTHTVPLSKPAVAVLREMGGLFGSAPDALIFPGRKAKRPLSDMTLLKVLRDMDTKEATVHGFRSSFRDWCAEMCPTVPGDVAEAALAHKVKDKT